MTSRYYGFLERGCGDRTLDDASVALLTALTAASTRNEVLDIIRDLEIADRAVSDNSFGGATSVDNT
jgi:hypothetical protein